MEEPRRAGEKRAVVGGEQEHCEMPFEGSKRLEESMGGARGSNVRAVGGGKQ